jgi:hypothetical protein
MDYWRVLLDGFNIMNTLVILIIIYAVIKEI